MQRWPGERAGAGAHLVLAGLAYAAHPAGLGYMAWQKPRRIQLKKHAQRARINAAHLIISDANMLRANGCHTEEDLFKRAVAQQH